MSAGRHTLHGPNVDRTHWQYDKRLQRTVCHRTRQIRTTPDCPCRSGNTERMEKKPAASDTYHDFMCTRQYYENLPRQHTRAVITTAGNLRSQTNNHCKTHIHTHAHNPGLLQTPRRHTTTPPHTVSRIQAIHPYFQPRTHGTLHGTTTTVGEPDTTVQPAPHNRGRRDRYAPREFAAL